MSVKKHTKISFPIHFEDNCNQLTENKIADTFNNYFTNIAQTIVNDIKYEGTKDFTYYLNRQINSTIKINNIDEEAVKKIIHNLPTKHSHATRKATNIHTSMTRHEFANEICLTL